MTFEEWRIKYWITSVPTEIKFSSAYNAGKDESAADLAEMKEQYLKFFNLHHTLAVQEAGIKGILCDALEIEHYQHSLYELAQMVTVKFEAMRRVLAPLSVKADVSEETLLALLLEAEKGIGRVIQH